MTCPLSECLSPYLWKHLQWLAGQTDKGCCVPFWQEIKITFDPFCSHNLRFAQGFRFLTPRLSSSAPRVTLLEITITLHSLKGDSFYTMASKPYLGTYQNKKHLTGSWIGGVGGNLRLAVQQVLWA